MLQRYCMLQKNMFVPSNGNVQPLNNIFTQLHMIAHTHNTPLLFNWFSFLTLHPIWKVFSTASISRVFVTMTDFKRTANGRGWCETWDATVAKWSVKSSSSSLVSTTSSGMGTSDLTTGMTLNWLGLNSMPKILRNFRQKSHLHFCQPVVQLHCKTLCKFDMDYGHAVWPSISLSRVVNLVKMFQWLSTIQLFFCPMGR